MKTIKIMSIIVKSLLTLFGVFMLIFFIGESISGITSSLDFYDIFGLVLMPFVFIIGVIVMWKREVLGSIIIIFTIILLNIVFMVGNQSFSLQLEFGLLLLLAVIQLLLTVLSRRLKTE